MYFWTPTNFIIYVQCFTQKKFIQLLNSQRDGDQIDGKRAVTGETPNHKGQA